MTERKQSKPGIVESTKNYEDWLRAALKTSGVGRKEREAAAHDLDEKHKKMRNDAFTFMRATYWRWAETIDDICGKEFIGAPKVLAVGDIHLENYGVWRDEDGRLIWGVNDFDEAARMPYAYDLVRLAVSARLSPMRSKTGIARICGLIVQGYMQGLAKPGAFVLDRDNAWLRRQFEVDQAERGAFWAKIDTRRAGQHRKIPDPFKRALKAALPKHTRDIEYFPSDAGTGSLGRPRWIAYGTWCGAPVLREVKAVISSAWTRSHSGPRKIRCETIATGIFRAPDPHYRREGTTVLRRLSPNSHKLEVDKHGPVLADPKMLRMMAFDLANAHLGTADKRKDRAARIEDHLKSIARTAFIASVRSAEGHVRGEHREWAAQNEPGNSSGIASLT